MKVAFYDYLRPACGFKSFKNSRSFEAAGMKGEEEGEEVCRTVLPDHLVEKIISMLPFPTIFKARCLSKSWLARLSPILSQQDESSQELARSFQRQLAKCSSTWRTFCPVYIDAEVFTAYDKVSGKWLKLPSLSYLSKEFLRWSTLQMEGPLLYGFAREGKGFARDLTVVNVLTGSWKLLPNRPNEGKNVVFCLKLVIRPDMETYKVVLVCRDGMPYPNSVSKLNRIYVQIYDSTSDGWIEKTFSTSIHVSTYEDKTAEAYLSGVLYIANLEYNSLELMAIDINGGTLKEIKMLDVRPWQFESARLVVCNGTLFVVLDMGFRSAYELDLRKIDLSSGRISKVAKFVEKGKMYFNPLSDGDRIFLLGFNRQRPEEKQASGFPQPFALPPEIFFGSHVMEYDVGEDKFTFLSDVPPPANQERKGDVKSWIQPGLTPFIDRCRHRWISSAFRPGVSPFLAV